MIAGYICGEDFDGAGGATDAGGAVDATGACAANGGSSADGVNWSGEQSAARSGEKCLHLLVTHRVAGLVVVVAAAASGLQLVAGWLQVYVVVLSGSCWP